MNINECAYIYTNNIQYKNEVCNRKESKLSYLKILTLTVGDAKKKKTYAKLFKMQDIYYLQDAQFTMTLEPLYTNYMQLKPIILDILF